MKRKFIMMENEAGLFGVAPAGPELQLMPNSRQERTPHSPPYPSALYSTPCMYLQCTGQQWAGRQIKAFTSMYKSAHTGSTKGRVIAITQMGI